jgi:aryl-alcohol dehydrogenase-like predicted oxidoreductase
MNYRALGSTGLRISEIGFGAWGIGGTQGDARAYGPTDDAVSARALECAFDAGITFYDTAALYGYGHSEELIGATLNRVRDRIVISTKVGYLDFSGTQDFSAAQIRRSLELSLKRLKTDYVDLFQLHDPPIELLCAEGEVIATLRELEKEGKIRVAGISTRSPKDSLTAVNELGFKSVQVNFSLVDQRCIELGIFQACREAGAGIIARTPLCFGFLTGKYENQSYAAGDHRNLWKPEQIACWAKAYQLFAAELPRQGELSHAQIALRYILSFDAVSSTIPGMLTDEHVLENAASSALGPYGAKELERFAAIYAENRFFV